MIDLVRFLF